MVRFQDGRGVDEDAHEPQTFCAYCDTIDVEFLSQKRVQVEQNAKLHRARMLIVNIVLNNADKAGLSGSSCNDFMKAPTIRISHTAIDLTSKRQNEIVLRNVASSFEIIFVCIGVVFRPSDTLFSGTGLLSGGAALSGEVGRYKSGPLSPLSYL